MKKVIIYVLTLLSVLSCYDDSAIWDKLQEHEERIDRLEKLCNELNSNISALEGIVEALQANDYVTGIYTLTEEGVDLGYKITFSKSGDINIYHGKAGAAGAPGQDGADGADGKDGHTPQIGVRKDTDGIYYWTLDGEWLTDSEGNKIPTTGKDGADGEPGEDGKPGAPGQDGEDGEDGEAGKPGQNGKDGVTPLLKIEDDYWYISYDNGQSWQQLYKAVGEDGAAGANGTDGAPGKDGQSFFQSVDTTNPNYIILTLADGTTIKIPTWKAFEELQIKINKLNTNLTALQAIIEALESNMYVTEISPIMEDGKEAGYIIYLSDGKFISIYHGKDGEDGAPGQDGEDGKDGVDGKDGHTPVIGVRKATEEDWSLDSGWLGDPATGYYWTIDGEWLLDSDGNKIPATGHNGITPLLKIEDGIWYVSTDEGKTWKAKGPATGSNVESIFSDISYNSEYLYLTLATGETISLSRHKEKLSIACSIEPTEITDRKVTFTGHLDVQADVLPYSQITLYYSDAEVFNIYTAESISTSVFDYKNCFEFRINQLEPETQYSYCICAKVLQDEMYSPIKTFQTDTERIPGYGGDGTIVELTKLETRNGITYINPNDSYVNWGVAGTGTSSKYLVPALTGVTIEVNPTGSYGFVLADENGLILESVKSSDIVSGEYTFQSHKKETYLYTSDFKLTNIYGSLTRNAGYSLIARKQGTLVSPTQIIGTPVQFGTQSYHDIYLIPAGMEITITIAYHGHYGFALTDLNGIVIDYTGTDHTGTENKMYTFEIQANDSYLYVSPVKLLNMVAVYY